VSTLKPKSAAELWDQQATLDYLPESYGKPKKASKIPNAASGKTEDTEALKKISTVLEEDKITNLKFHADYIHLVDPKVSYQMLKRCEKNSLADFLYSEQPKDLSLIAEYVNNHPNAILTAGMSEKIYDVSHKEIYKLLSNIVDLKWKKTALMK
jgi:hypothetical protein